MSNILYIVGILCAVWVIYDVWTKQKMGAGEKLLWTILALVFSVVTAIVYYFVKKK